MTSAVRVDGAVDLHCHFGPEPVVERVTGGRAAVTPETAAREAAKEGQRAIVLKPHEFPTVGVAHALNDAIDGVSIIGGITCDAPIGGINPAAVRTALDNGARVVWLPTLSAASAPDAKRSVAFGDAPACDVAVDGRLTDEVRDVIELTVQHGAVLATGHIGRDEQFLLAEAMRQRGTLLVTHALQNGVGPDLTVSDCVELAALGAYLEFTAHTCQGQIGAFEDVINVIGQVGVERCVLSSDLGWSEHLPHPAAGLTNYLRSLDSAGVSARDLELMAGRTPARLIGLE